MTQRQGSNTNKSRNVPSTALYWVALTATIHKRVERVVVVKHFMVVDERECCDWGKKKQANSDYDKSAGIMTGCA